MYTDAQKLYIKHKKSSKERGIEFLFSFEAWANWWWENLGDNWMNLRGRGDGKYVMARKLDKGPYAPWNVECMLFGDNVRATRTNGTSAYGERQHLAKITAKIAKAIFLAKGSEVSIGKRFGVTRYIVHNVKARKTWCQATKGLGTAPRVRKKGLNEEIAVSIFLDARRHSVISDEYGTSLSTIWSIKYRRTWRKATEHL